MAFWRQWRLHLQCRAISETITEHSLPPEDFQGAVVLVCGDTTSLFSGNTVWRETRHGWYLQVQSAEALPLLAQHLAAVRPALVSQVSVMLAMTPEQHISEETCAQALRHWRRSIVQCRTWLNGLPPIWGVVWVSPPVQHSDEVLWFTVTPDLPGIRARQNGQVALPVTGWQQEAVGDDVRLANALWLDSVHRLSNTLLFRPLRTRQEELPACNLCAVGICLTPVAGVSENLWSRQIAGTTTLPPSCGAADDLLPLPDVLLALLPRHHGVSRRMQDTRLAGAICFVFLALAMLASFINNQRLVRSVGVLMTSNLGSDHLMQLLQEQPEATGGDLHELLRPILRDHFQPALLARFQTVIYRPLGQAAMRTIVGMKLNQVSKRLARHYGMKTVIADSLLDALTDACLLPDTGARNIDSLLNQQILPVLSQQLLTHMAAGQKPQCLTLGWDEDGGIVIELRQAGE